MKKLTAYKTSFTESINPDTTILVVDASSWSLYQLIKRLLIVNTFCLIFQNFYIVKSFVIKKPIQLDEEKT